ncbi:MAG: CHASE2 domain-containing protein [Nostoc sp. DcaGUA01]|nr:CHASE2 domain-containing protein [Nostoc sp. SerVER01]MDZ8080643.1 CHASE2 domain-containing protein [Nostoc sp. DcaGUA01]
MKSISDSTLAQLLNKLQKYQPRVIGLDIYRDFADPSNKSKPIQVATELSKENVVVVCKGRDRKHDPQGVKPPLEVPIERQGFTDAIQDPDGIVRRQIMMMAQEPSSVYTTPYSLSLN